VTSFRSGVRRLFRLAPRSATTIHDEVDEEIELLVQSRVQQLVARGMSFADARAEALRRLGDDPKNVRRRLHRSAEQRERRLRIRELVENLRQDLGYAVHGFRNEPAFAITAVGVLALGIGANAAMFGIVDRLLFRPPAYLGTPDRVHRLYFARTSSQGGEFANNYTQFVRYRDVLRLSRTIEIAAAYARREIAIGRGESTRELPVGVATSSLWRLFTATPAIGRFFTDAEAEPRTGSRVAVLSHSYWQSQFGGSPSALGQAMLIGPTEYTIVGVAPPGFAALDASEPVAFVPVGPFGDENMGRGPDRYDEGYTRTWVEMFVRLRPGVTDVAASADLTDALVRSYAEQLAAAGRPLAPFVAANKPRLIVASPLFERGPRADNDAKIARWLLGVTIIVLLVTCANVGNLLLTRTLRRKREIGIRVALGASRGRLITQFLAESTALSIVGGAAGLIVAHLMRGWLQSTLLPGTALDHAVADVRVLVFGAILTLSVAILAGLAPALDASRLDIVSGLNSNRGGSSRSRPLRTALMLSQAALSVLLLVGAGLFVRSVLNVASTRLGFDADRLAWVEVQGRGAQFDTATRVALRERLMERARALPATFSVTPAITVPFGAETVFPLFVAGVDSVEKLGAFVLQTAGPTYFETMGTRIVRGRAIVRDDGPGAAKVIVVSQSMAGRLWPSKDPLGQCVRLGAESAPCRVVVGVAEDVKHGEFGADAPMLYYVPIMQSLHAQGWFFVRTRGPAASQTDAIRRDLQAIIPPPSFVTVTPLTASIVDAERSWRLGATMFAAFGGLALAVAAIGLYGLIAYGVAQRTHEIGVRIALGARPVGVAGMVVRQGVSLVLVGTSVGFAGAFAASPWVGPLLFNESPRDPAVFGTVAATVVLVAVAATAIPARRAAVLDPLTALRAD
jgi:putative ABC transport system permease protein